MGGAHAACSRLLVRVLVFALVLQTTGAGVCPRAINHAPGASLFLLRLRGGASVDVVTLNLHGAAKSGSIYDVGGLIGGGLLF
jgi:hypothetical protein